MTDKKIDITTNENTEHIHKQVNDDLKDDQTTSHLSQNQIAEASYGWVATSISLYSRARNYYKIDFDSFMIILVVLSHLNYLTKKEKSKKAVEGMDSFLEDMYSSSMQEELLSAKGRGLGSTSIAHVLGLPEETCRRKIQQLIKKNLLIRSTKQGITLHKNFVKKHKVFGLQTLKDVKSLMRIFTKQNLIKGLTLPFEVFGSNTKL
jgi:hypothetical protein|tara:strand:- start:3841 stop:4458 length:618 start_codon:yes stop_codon:yes gene_type:complete